jgi:hypothetical protein
MSVNLFKGVGKAKISESGTYLQPGNYLLEVQTTEYKRTEQKGDAFIATCKVVGSDNENVPIGSEASWYQGLTNQVVAWPALKGFTYAVCGLDSKLTPQGEIEEFDGQIEAMLEKAVAQGGRMFQGKRIRCEVKLIKTKEGKDFSKHTFRRIEK